MQDRDISAGQTSNLPQNLAISICYDSETWRFIILTLLIEDARQRHLGRPNIKPTTKSGHFYMLWFRNMKNYYINFLYWRCKTETSQQAKRQTCHKIWPFLYVMIQKREDLLYWIYLLKMQHRDISAGQTSNLPQNLAISICYDSKTWRFIILNLLIGDARQRHLGRPNVKPTTKSGHFYMLWFRNMKIYYIKFTYRRCKTETSRQAKHQTYHKIWPFPYVMIQKHEDLLYWLYFSKMQDRDISAGQTSNLHVQ